MNKNADFIALRHGSILSPEWRFVKICAISPSLNSKETICKNCHRFILTTELLKTPGGLETWWQETGLSNRGKMLNQQLKEIAYSEFQLFFFRLVCLSSVRLVPDPFHTWTQIQGKNPHHMAAGFTKVELKTTDHSTLGANNVAMILKEAHHAYKMLFFNKDQMALLTTNEFPSALFLCDFGAGKKFISFNFSKFRRIIN